MPWQNDSFPLSGLTIRRSITIVEGASTIADRTSLVKSAETSGRSSKPRIPFRSASAARASNPLTSSMVVSRDTVKTQSVSDAFSRGTRTAMPFSFPASSG